MSDWVEELIQNLEHANRLRKSLPDKINAFWAELGKTLDSDIKRLNSYFQPKFGPINLEISGPTSMKITTPDYPTYTVAIFQSREGVGAVRVTREVVFEDDDSKVKIKDFSFDFDSEDRLILKSDDITLKGPKITEQMS